MVGDVAEKVGDGQGRLVVEQADLDVIQVRAAAVGDATVEIELDGRICPGFTCPDANSRQRRRHQQAFRR
jgi:hypothetical protein